MLDSETRRRIDTARDILVGKVPDPKSQVEQITIALVYKFMDDMDKQSIEMGGKASFFKGKFAKYGWSNIFDPRLGGVEMLALYGEAITHMSQNENLPQLFRDIFKNAFLPYRDPETLKLFLKTINEFTYDHSEKLGDAFEYLLSVLGSQGDAGQFRTPRHIIDFMVQVIAPKKTETVLDPACGTAGFLISAYKYILKSNVEGGMMKDELGKGGKGTALTTQEKQRLYENFTGYDISPDMVRLSLVNLYLHGFVTPKVHEYDTLTSEERWNEYADVILANPPFMSPKGGIQPHKRFSVQSNRSEVLFVDYMAEHLTPNGRAAIIVPEGIIFQSAGAYKQLRKYLVENNYLWAVVSLPAGAFNPYSGVKTSILLLDKALAKKTDQILFVKVEADGFDLGAQRRPIERNDLPDALNILHAWSHVIARGASPEAISLFNEEVASGENHRPRNDMYLLVSTSRLADAPREDYNLSADRYREVARVGKQKYERVPLGDICENLDSQRKPVTKSDRTQGEYPYYGASGIVDYVHDYIFDGKYLLVSEDGANLLARSTPIAFSVEGKIWVNNHAHILKFKEPVIQTFVELYLNSIDLSNYVTGAAQPKLTQANLNNIPIPLPPLETQRQIVEEIAAHQRIIDGARQVVEGWKPNIEIELAEALPKGTDDCEKAKLSDVSEIIMGQSPDGESYNTEGIGVPLINGPVEFGPEPFSKTVKSKFTTQPTKYCKEGDLILCVRGSTTGRMNIAGFDACIGRGVAAIRSEKYQSWINHWIDAKRDDIYKLGAGSTFPNVTQDTLRNFEIPLPPLEVQREIVARIERERSIVEGNRELIRIYEEKVKKVIERVWES